MEKVFLFTPKQWVLVRDMRGEKWSLAQFSHKTLKHFVVVGGLEYSECIPYEGKEHLLGKADDYNVESYNPKEGDLVYHQHPYNNVNIGIFKEVDQNGNYVHYILMDRNNNLWTGEGAIINDRTEITRLATKDESDLFLSTMEKNGKKWDPDTKCVIDTSYIPKDGEFAVSGWRDGDQYCEWVFIQKGEFERGANDDYAGAIIRYHEEITGEDRIWLDGFSDAGTDFTRPATQEERDLLISRLHEIHAEWTDNKIIWIPTWEYYFVGSNGLVIREIWASSTKDKERLNVGNCFRTEREAQRYAIAFKRLLKRI